MTNNKKGVNPVAAGIAGAVIGAAAGAAAVVLSDEKNRKKIKGKIDEYKKKGQRAYSDLQDKVEEMKEEGEKKVKQVKKSMSR